MDKASRKDRLTKQAKAKAKARERGTCVFSSTHGSVKDNKDHYPINSISQARNALARASQHKGSPPWYSGTVSGLVSAVRGAVKRKYPSIKTTEKSKNPKKGSFKSIDGFLSMRGTLADVMGELKKKAQPAELIEEWENKAPSGSAEDELAEASRLLGGETAAGFEEHEDLPEEVTRLDPEQTQMSPEQVAGEAAAPVSEVDLESPNLMTSKQNIIAAAKKMRTDPDQLMTMVAEKEREEGMALTVDEIVECCGGTGPQTETFSEVAPGPGKQERSHVDPEMDDPHMRMLLDLQRRQEAGL